MCNLSGHSECDLTVSRIGQKEFFIASGGGSRTHDFFHIRNIIQDTNFDCKMTEETKNFTLLSIQGEDSKKILKKISLSNYFSNEHFPFSKTKIININSYQIRAIRLTFIGELGWELHLPKFCAKEIFELFIESGKEFNLQPSGYRAIDSLSAEKGYLHWQEDIRVDDTPLEANISFICKLKTDIKFLGKETLTKQNKQGLKKRLVYCRIKNPYIRINGLETIWKGKKCIGYLRRADFDYTINYAIGFAYLKRRNGGGITLSWIRGKSKKSLFVSGFEIEIMGKRFPLFIDLKPPFDKENLKITGNYNKLKYMM